MNDISSTDKDRSSFTAKSMLLKGGGNGNGLANDSVLTSASKVLEPHAPHKPAGRKDVKKLRI